MKVGIVGLGVIGASIGMALVASGKLEEVVGFDLDHETIKIAIDTRVIHHAAESLEQAAASVDVLFLATPIGTYEQILKTIAPCLKQGAIVTDTGSTKQMAIKKMKSLLPDYVNVVGGHPMAGSERTGISGADRYLLENAVYILTPDHETNVSSLKTVLSIIQLTGAKVMEFSPVEHDEMVAVISHLPHMVAVSLMMTLKSATQTYPATGSLAAGGFRDTTRIAEGSPVMWRDIIQTNKKALLLAIKSFKESLELIENAIALAGDGDTVKVMEQLTSARELRMSLPSKAKGLLTSIHEIVVTVPDRPGIIGELAAILGKHGINIADIEILRVREGDGGSIRVGFAAPEAAELAVQVLSGEGIIVKRR